MARPVLFYFAPSAPCRIALFAAKCLGLDIEVKTVDLFKKEQYNEDYLKINPQHTAPLLVDGDYVLSESRAIAIYLTEKAFPNGHSLYPTDLKERGLVNQRLYFDATVLYPRIRAICRPALFDGVTKINDKDRQSLLEAIGFLDTYLKGNKYVTGSEQPTLADLSLLASISSFVGIGGDLKNFSNVAAWYELCKSLPGNDQNIAGAKQFGDAVKSKLQDTL